MHLPLEESPELREQPGIGTPPPHSTAPLWIPVAVDTVSLRALQERVWMCKASSSRPPQPR